MPTTISGTSGVSQVQDGSIATADIQNGAITAEKLSGGQTGAAPVYGARAWAMWNGNTAGTNAPLAGGNVSTVQRESVGVYLLTFSVALPAVPFSILVTAQTTAGAGTRTNVCSAESISTTTVRVRTVSGADGNALDQSIISAAVFA